MSNYNSLKTTIDANIKQNGNQEITGQILNSVLNQMVNALGVGYQFAGVATLDPATDPGTPDAKVFYIANGKGTYTNFGGIEVTEDEVVVLYWDSSWHKVSTGIASNEKLTELELELGKKTFVNNTPSAAQKFFPVKLKKGSKYKVTNNSTTPIYSLYISKRKSIDASGRIQTIISENDPLPPSLSRTFICSVDEGISLNGFFGNDTNFDIALIGNVEDSIHSLQLSQNEFNDIKNNIRPYAYISDGKLIEYENGKLKIPDDIYLVSDDIHIIQIESVFNACTAAGFSVNNNTIDCGNVFILVFNCKTKNINVGNTRDILYDSQNIPLFVKWYNSTSWGLLMDYFIDKNQDALKSGINGIESEINGIESEINEIQNKLDNVPSYYRDHIDQKCDEILQNMTSAGINGETFIFITDQHWNSNDRNSPKLIKYLLSKTNISTIICGGDLIGEGTKISQSKLMAECVRSFCFENMFFPCAFGNHDSNRNNQEQYPDRWFDYNSIYALMYKQCDRNIHFITKGTFNSFYFDNEQTKTRFIFCDTGIDGWAGTIIKGDVWTYDPSDQLDGIVNTMLSCESGWKIIIVAHWIGHETLNAFGKDISSLVDGYNKKSDSVHVPGANKNYNLSTSKGECVLILGGHIHNDFDITTPDGIKLILSDSDNGVRSENTKYPYVKGTITEQSFDVITVDYEKRLIKCVKIGRGENRNFSY